MKTGRFSGVLLVKAFIQVFALIRGGKGQERPAFPNRTKKSQAVVLGMPNRRPASMRGNFFQSGGEVAREACSVFHAIVFIRDDGHYFPETGD